MFFMSKLKTAAPGSLSDLFHPSTRSNLTLNTFLSNPAAVSSLAKPPPPAASPFTFLRENLGELIAERFLSRFIDEKRLFDQIMSLNKRIGEI